MKSSFPRSPALDEDPPQTELRVWKGLSHLELPHHRGVIVGILRAPAVQPEGVAEVGEMLEVLHVLQLRLVDLGKEKGESGGEGKDWTAPGAKRSRASPPGGNATPRDILAALWEPCKNYSTSKKDPECAQVSQSIFHPPEGSSLGAFSFQPGDVFPTPVLPGLLCYSWHLSLTGT